MFLPLQKMNTPNIFSLFIFALISFEVSSQGKQYTELHFQYRKTGKEKKGNKKIVL